MTSTIGFVLLLVGSVRTVWILFWYILNSSSQVGTKISKKIGTDNENTDKYLEDSKGFSSELKEKLIWRVGITLVGFLLYYFG